ncbi:hypothetical protein AJ80_02252 [Polytolypa hystricis UAMH7299]|uniref:RNA helicase n=1 Tax=Polytolypa hystricis (strain UAMH7299) TaxID=1447883 RepID=A0A2B7YPQ4_POLH7|nr:hypothetical protein AJ80_02252 [Polytolypa hystricis UAMH7299]
MSALTSLCLFCQLRAAPARQKLPLTTSWQSVRFASANALRRKPSRMALSRDVAKPSLQKSPKRFQNSPFGAMNLTEANIRGKPQRTRSEAEMKRSSSFGTKDGSVGGKRKKETAVFKALKMQTSLSPVPYGRRNAIKARIAEVDDFHQFPILPSVCDAIYKNALEGLTEVTPTPIQRVAIPTLVDRAEKPKKTKTADDENLHDFDQFLLAAETGSGKTLGYLVPVVDAIKRAEVEEKIQQEQEEIKKREEEKANPNVWELESPELSSKENAADVARPRAIILVPTSELVTQVGKLVKQLSHTVKYRSAMISSSLTPRRITNSVFALGGIDILVATPHLLSSIAKTNPYILSRVSHLVIDEADSLLDRSFAPTTSIIIDKTAPTLKQLILCSATIPRSLDTFMRTRFPDIRRLVTPNLHAIPRRVQLGVVDIQKDPYMGNRDMACADIIWSLGKSGDTYDSDNIRVQGIGREPKNLIVFVNERETAESVATYLVQKGIHAVALTRDTSEQRQGEILETFTTGKAPPTTEDIKTASKMRKKFLNDAVPFAGAQSSDSSYSKNGRLQDVRVLVTTDLGSRGIDTITVRTVILYDVPHTTIDFIHRLGRTGRMGRRGRGIVLVGKKDRKDVVKEVREAMFRGQALI